MSAKKIVLSFVSASCPIRHMPQPVASAVCLSGKDVLTFFLGPYDPNWLQNYKIRTPLVNPFNISYPFLALFLSFVALPPSLLPSSPLPLLAL